MGRRYIRSFQAGHQKMLANTDSSVSSGSDASTNFPEPAWTAPIAKNEIV